MSRMAPPAAAATSGWSGRLSEGVRPYLDAAPLAAAGLGVSSGFAFAMIGAVALVIAARNGWAVAYAACALFALPLMLVGVVMYASIGMKRSVFVSLVLMAVSNLSFSALAAFGHSNLGMAGAIGFENFASGIGGVAVVAYLSALSNLRFTATQYALLSALASIAVRFLTGTTAGALIEAMGYVNFYLPTTLIALPGVALYGYMVQSGLADVSIGTAGTDVGESLASRSNGQHPDRE